MMKYDAHVHFDCTKESPYDDIKEKLKSNDIDKCTLILNSIEEESIFFENYEAIKKDKIINIIAAILDFRNKKSIEIFSMLNQIEISIAIKLHPRLTNITSGDFEDIYQAIKKIDSKIIVVDCFTYGPQLCNHIGVELALFLAERFADKNIIIAHAGGCDLLKTMLLTRPVRNIYYDFSLSCNYLENTSVYLDMINGLKFWSNRIMFGTDYPDIRFEESVRVMSKMCMEAGLTDAQRAGIFYDNAMMIYGREY